MARCQQLRKILGLCVVPLLMLAGATGCQADDPPPPSPVVQAANQAPTCSGDNADRRFAYADERERAHDLASARAALEGLLANCNEGVRTRALEWLLRLPRVAQPAPPSVPNPLTVNLSCPGAEFWDQRFEYVEAFSKSGDVAAALTLLQSALGDCDASVRQKAAERLKQLPSPPPTAACPAFEVWNQRFIYVDKLAVSDTPGARNVLIGGLADCNPEVREKALKLILPLISPAPPSPSPSPSPPYCALPETWSERLAYADKLQGWGDVATARTVLTAALADCNAKIRGQALNRLAALIPPPVATCPGWTIWRQRFEYSLRLKNSGDIVDARALLTPALADCDDEVRRAAFEALDKMVDGEPRPVAFWRGLRAQTGGWFDTLGKALVLLLVALLVLLICRALSLTIYRKQLLVQPLNVAGDGFDGARFVALATHVSLLMDAMRWTGAPGQNAWRANLAPGNATELAAQVSVAEAFAGDSAGKVIAALASVIKQPRYLCSGTVYISQNQAQILIQLNRRSFFWPHLLMVDHWEEACSAGQVMDRLKQLAYLMLHAAAHSITGDGIAGNTGE
jgi:HEAT repeat protein